MDDSLPNAVKLTSWLHHSAALPQGEVSDVQINLEHETPISKLYFLSVTYTPEAPTDLPHNIVVKSPLISSVEFRPSESQFYRELAMVIGTPPAVRCLAAIENYDGKVETLVLEDLRATHDHPPFPLPPTPKQCELAIDTLAGLHAQFWEAPTLGVTLGQGHTTDSLTKMVNGFAQYLPAFLDWIGDKMPAHGREIYERVFSSSLKPWLRLTESRALTIVHGDAHSWNFLFPRSGQGDTFLIDWQLWHVDVGARDLAFLMGLHWDSHRRRDLESSLVRHYHDGLLRRGIANYTHDDLWLDYRRCVVRNLTIPILLWTRRTKPEYWWHRLECALAAYQELGGDELL